MTDLIHPDQPAGDTANGYTILEVLHYIGNIGGLRFDCTVSKGGKYYLASVYKNQDDEWIAETRPYRGAHRKITGQEEGTKWPDYPNDGKNYRE